MAASPSPSRTHPGGHGLLYALGGLAVVGVIAFILFVWWDGDNESTPSKQDTIDKTESALLHAGSPDKSKHVWKDALDTIMKYARGNCHDVGAKQCACLNKRINDIMTPIAEKHCEASSVPVSTMFARNLGVWMKDVNDRYERNKVCHANPLTWPQTVVTCRARPS